VAIAAGGFHSLALKDDGTVVLWGGYGLIRGSVPTGLAKVVAIATGDYHSLALKADGTVVAWGLNTAGQCEVPGGLRSVALIAARGSHSMVLLDDLAPLSKAPLVPAASGRSEAEQVQVLRL
jgi:alpha-tubulin suppressor-like RCC1 family protein